MTSPSFWGILRHRRARHGGRRADLALRYLVGPVFEGVTTTFDGRSFGEALRAERTGLSLVSTASSPVWPHSDRVHCLHACGSVLYRRSKTWVAGRRLGGGSQYDKAGPPQVPTFSPCRRCFEAQRGRHGLPGRSSDRIMAPWLAVVHLPDYGEQLCVAVCGAPGVLRGFQSG